MAGTMAHNIFISYRRINGDIMARMICDGLRATNRYDNIYLDVDDHTAGNYIETIEEHIKNSHTCIVVLSKGALDRCAEEGDVVRHEIALAKECGLKIVPVMITGNDYAFSGFPEDLPPDIRFIRMQNACIYYQATSSHYIEDLCRFIDGDSSREAVPHPEDHARQIKKKRPFIAVLAIPFVMILMLIILLIRGFSARETGTRSEDLSVRPLTDSLSYWEFSIPHVAFGRDWNGGHLYCTEPFHETAYAEYELNGIYRELSFDYIPFADEFYKNEEYGPNRMQIFVINAANGEILGEGEWVTKDSAPGHLEVDVAGVDRVRITARRDGPFIEGEDPSLFSADMILKNEILRR